MLFNILCLIHIILCLLIILLVLIQHGKGADAGAIMGSGAEAMLGAGNAGNVISRITTSAAIAFMVTSILLARFYQSSAPAPVEVKALKNSVVAEETSDADEPARLELPVFPEGEASKKEESSETVTDTKETKGDETAKDATSDTSEVVSDKVEETTAETKDAVAESEKVAEVKEETSDVKVEDTKAAVEQTSDVKEENVQNDAKEAAEKVAE